MRTAISRIYIVSVSLALAFLGVSSTATISWAQNPVTFKTTVSPSNPRPGEYVRIDVDAAVASGWHLYSLVATAPPGPSPTSISLGDSCKLNTSTLKTSEDTPTIAFDRNFAKTVAFHTIKADFYVAGEFNGSAGKAETWPLTIHYQTCNDTMCLPPTSKILHVVLTPNRGAVRSEYSSPPSLPTLVTLPVTSVVQPSNTARPDSWFGFMAEAFTAGLFALLTPCVFPLIPVTFGFFTKQIGEGSVSVVRRKLIIMASVYALGIIISFTVLGLVAAAVLGASGANRVAAIPWFNIFFGVLFVVFAFSFFEAFQLTLPPSLMRFASPSGKTNGIGGVLLMGLAFVFAAFTCTAPFIGTVLVTAATANTATAWARPVVGMLCFSIALALPFFALALFPGLLTKLPRSGGWLTQFKATLGFVELAYALTYFSKADLVWQAHILTRPVVLGLWAMIALAGALYLLGLLRVSAFPDEPSKISYGRGIFATVFGVVSILCLYALTGRPVAAAVAAYLPPDQYGLSKIGSHEADSSLGSDSAWLPSLDAAEVDAKQNGKPIFIDFTGYTCTNCRYVELNTFTKQPVTDLLENQFNRVRLYTDGGSDASANQAFQQKLVGTVALPYYAIVDASGNLVKSIGGSSWSVDQFGSFLESGAAPGTAVALSKRDPKMWATYSDRSLIAAQKSAKPVIIDFTASWCTNCHAIEKQVFTASSVTPELPKFSTLRMDLTDFYSVSNAAIENKYHILALPAVVFLSPVGTEVPDTRVTGLITANEFLQRMRTAESSH